MKTFIIFTIIAASVAMLLSSCQTIEQPHRDQRHTSTGRAERTRLLAAPYYQSTAEGDYYHKAETDTNEDCRPQLRRRLSGRGN
jgi:hypothetical protein